jgi:hypothetical protein
MTPNDSAPVPEPPRPSDDRFDLVTVLAALLNSMLWGLLLGVVFITLVWLVYLYMHTATGNWMYGLIGLDHNASNIIMVATVSLFKMTLWWLAILCFIVWLWKKRLQETRSKKGNSIPN